MTFIPNVTYTEFRLVSMKQGALTLPDTWFRPSFWDLLMLQLLRPVFPNLPCLFSTFHLEYPSVLSRFCSSHICQIKRIYHYTPEENNRIYHYTPEGKRESHPSVHDLQSTARLAECCRPFRIPITGLVLNVSFWPELEHKMAFVYARKDDVAVASFWWQACNK